MVDEVQTTSSPSQKITQMPSADIPLTGSEIICLVQGGTTKQTALLNIDAVFGVTDAPVIMATADTATYPNSRTLTAGSGISISDGGSGGNITLSTTSNGDVVGPSSSTDANFPSFSGTTGKLIQDSGYSASSFQTSNSGLSAIAGLSTTGLITRTGAGTAAARSVVGTSNRVSVANGDGVSGDPTVDIAATYVGQTSITTLGTVATGTWNATTIATTKGGTGQTAYDNGELLIGNSTTSGLTKATLSGTGGIVVTNGPGSIVLSVSGAGTGSVTNVSVVTANGISGTVANPTTTPAITLELGNITPSNVTPTSGGALRTATASGATLVIQAYDVNDTAYRTFGTATAGNTPTFALAAPSGGTLTIDGAALGGTAACSLGTPSSGILTNCTGFPVASLSGLGTGVATFLATPNSANLAAALTDETGTGFVVYSSGATTTGMTINNATVTSATISGGTINNTVIGATTSAAGTFSTVNKVSITPPATSATFTLFNGSTLATSGANSLTMITTGDSIVTFPTTGTLATTASLASYVPYTGATGDVYIGTYTYLGHAIKADASDGLFVFSNNGTSAALFGAGGGSNATFYGGVTINGTLTAGDDVTVSAGKAIKTNTTAGNTYLLQAYDVDNTTYRTFATLTAGNTPSMAIAAPSGGTLAIDGAALGGSAACSLGTPSSGTLTNCTGFPTANLSGLGTGVATFLATPSSANLAAALTDETGTGFAVFSSGATTTGLVVNNATITSATISGGTINNTTVGGTTPCQIQGYRPINAQTTSTYTLVIGDSGKLVSMSSASANTLIVPTNASVAFPTGTEVDLFQWGAGQTTVSGSGGSVTIKSYTSKVLLAGQNAGATLKKLDTDTWLLVGNLA